MSTSEAGGDKKFSRLFHRTLLRTKEKMMAGLGKADRTQDSDFEKHSSLFYEQQNTANNLFKSFRNYANQVKATAVASSTMHQTISDAFEYSWEGVEEFIVVNEQLNTAWEKYNAKLNEHIYQQILEYANKFPEVKAKMMKRGRKLIDYDSARHNLQSLTSAKKRNEYKINNAQRELTSSRIIYDNINNELAAELPVLHQSRVPSLSSYFTNLLSAQTEFHDEMHRVTDKLASMTSEIKIKKSFAIAELDKISEKDGEQTDIHTGVRPLDDGLYQNAYNGTQTGTMPLNKQATNVARGGSLAQTNSERRAAYYGQASGSFEKDQEGVAGSDYQNMAEVKGRVAPVRRNSSGRKNAGTLPTTTVSTENKPSSPKSMTLLSKAMEQRSPPVKQGPEGNPFEESQMQKIPPVIPPPPNIQAIPPPPTTAAADSLQNAANSASSTMNSAANAVASAANITVSSANSASDAAVSAANSAGSAISSAANSAGSAISSAANSAVSVANSAAQHIGVKVDEPATVFRVVAMHDYDAVEGDELTLKAGDVIEIIPTDEQKPNLEEGWQLGIRLSDKKKGIFPVNFTKLVE